MADKERHPLSGGDSHGCPDGSGGCRNGKGPPVRGEDQPSSGASYSGDAWVLQRAEDEIREAELAPQPRKDWRVTVRLTPGLYDQLLTAAALYGTTPTTLARMLINRGARAIVREERRADRLLGPLE